MYDNLNNKMNSFLTDKGIKTGSIEANLKGCQCNVLLLSLVSFISGRTWLCQKTTIFIFSPEAIHFSQKTLLPGFTNPSISVPLFPFSPGDAPFGAAPHLHLEPRRRFL